MPGVPFPICRNHAVGIFTHIRDALGSAERPELIERERAIMTRAFQGAPVVYYLRVDGWIKIGYTVNLAQRMRAYPPSAALLGVERGTPSLERRRHRQFCRFLARGGSGSRPARPCWSTSRTCRTSGS